jgi:anti-sigma-K factor RskA
MPDDRTIDPRDELDPEIEALLAELDADDLEPVAPPASIWDGIERRLADDDASGGARAPVVRLQDRRRRPPMFLLAAAAAVVVVLGATIVVNRGTDTTLVASTPLTYDPATFDPLGADAAATARLVERDGNFEIELTDTVLPEVGAADLELWMIEVDDTGEIVDVAPVSLVDGSGYYVVPDAIDVSTHTIVDISVEPRDGDATHSGRSILRGALPTA